MSIIASRQVQGVSSVLVGLGLFLLRVVAVFTGWMVDKAFKEVSASGSSSSSSPAEQPACLQVRFPVFVHYLLPKAIKSVARKGRFTPGNKHCWE
jgi:hypothetical protein